MADDVRVVRISPGVLWHALHEDEVVGRAHVLHRPDSRTFIGVDAWHDDVFQDLVAAVVTDVDRDLHASVDEQDQRQLGLLRRSGFHPVRAEDEYLIPTASSTSFTPPAPAPAPGYRLISAQDADVAALAALDEQLREDVPGASGWVNDVEAFRAYTFDPRHFDADTYLIAVEERTGQYVGVVRIWHDSRIPRLGLIGVVRGRRRRGLARTLLAAAFQPVRARGIEEVSAEVDTTNLASQALMADLGARRIGGSIEVLRRQRSAPD